MKRGESGYCGIEKKRTGLGPLAVELAIKVENAWSRSLDVG